MNHLRTTQEVSPDLSEDDSGEVVSPRERPYIGLIGERDVHLRHEIMHLMQQIGFTTVGVDDGSQLLAWLEPLLLQEDHGLSPDIVVTNLALEGIEPLAIVEGLARLGCRVPVIVVSDVHKPGTRMRVAELGFCWIDRALIAVHLKRAILRAILELESEQSAMRTITAH